MAGDDAGNGLRIGHRLADADGDLAPGAKPAPAGRVVHLDRDVAHAQQVARLPDPGELKLGGAAEAPQENALERLALPLICALVDVEHEAPGRALLVVVVPVCEHGSHAREPDLSGRALLDLPGERSQADAVGRAATRPSADPPARADRLAVACLQVGA